MNGAQNIAVVKKASGLLKKMGNFAQVKSPTIFAGIAIAGVGATMIMSVRAGMKASKIIAESTTIDPDTGEEIRPTAKEVVQMTWTCYIPPFLMCATTMGAIVMSHNISSRRNAALAGLYSMSQDALKEYEEKVEKVLGKRNAEKVSEEIIEDKLASNPISQRNVIATGLGDTLCYDTWSGRYFKSDVHKIKHAVDEFNIKLAYGEACSINEFYELMDLDEIGGGYDVGWSTSKPLEVRYVSKLASNGTPCFVIDYITPPRWSFQEF